MALRSTGQDSFQWILKRGHKENIFILASQVKQVFYIIGPADKNWFIVLLTKPNIIPDCDDMNKTEDNIDDVPSFSVGLTREDNSEGDD